MTRFDALLKTIVTQFQLRASCDHTTYEGHMKHMAYWLPLLQQRNPHVAVIDPLAGRSDLEVVWTLEKAFCLYRDRFLEIPIWYSYYYNNPGRLAWCEPSKEALLVRLHEPEEIVKVFATFFWVLREPYESKHNPDFFATRSFETARVTFTRELWERYDQTQRFFGAAFGPLMEAYKLHEEGERTTLLYPLMPEGGSCTIAATEVNRLVATHLGVWGYNCLAGHKHIAGVQERCEVTLESYSDAERQRVVAFLMGQKRKAFAVRFLLCELALRRFIPTGVYTVQAEGA